MRIDMAFESPAALITTITLFESARAALRSIASADRSFCPVWHCHSGHSAPA